MLTSQYLELVLTVVFGDGVFDQVSMWHESLREGPSKRSEVVVSIQDIARSIDKPRGEIVSFRYKSFRSTYKQDR